MNAKKVFTDESQQEQNNKDYNMEEDTDDEIERVQKTLDQEAERKESKESTRKGEKEINEGKTDDQSRKRKSSSPDVTKKRSKVTENKEAADNDSAYEVETDEENSDDAYSAETDVESENIEDMKSRLSDLPLPKYPQIFKGKQFFLKGLKEGVQKLLERYIVCYGGDVQMYNSNSVNYIITKSASKP